MASPYAPEDSELVACAKRAWASEGKYPLERWTVRLGYTVAVLAYGTPPRAKYEYTHAFLFTSTLQAGQWVWALQGTAKAPWHKPLTWQGARFLQGSGVRYYPPTRYSVSVRAFTPA